MYKITLRALAGRSQVRRRPIPSGQKKRAGGKAPGPRITQIVERLRLREMEHLEEVADCRSVGRPVRVTRCCRRVRQVVAAAGRDRVQPPVTLDELVDR